MVSLRGPRQARHEVFVFPHPEPVEGLFCVTVSQAAHSWVTINFARYKELPRRFDAQLAGALQISLKRRPLTGGRARRQSHFAANELNHFESFALSERK